MSARQEIFNALTRGRVVPPPSLIPAPFSFGSNRELLTRFCDRAGANGITIHLADETRDLPQRVRESFGEEFTGKRCCAAPGLAPLLRQDFRDLYFGPNDGRFALGISTATAAVAQTGALALARNPDNPSTIAFLSQTHLFILKASDICETMTDVLTRPAAAACALHFIAGPSSTADIGGKLLTGVHGPGRVDCLILTSD